MIKVTDIFSRPQGQSFDLTQGVDIVDFFNAGIASPINQLEQDLNIESKVEFERKLTTEDVHENAQDRRDIFSQPTNESSGFGFEQRGVEVGDFSVDPIDVPDFESNNTSEDFIPTPQSGDFDPASLTFNREARKDSKGRLRVFNPPSGDGGGSFEVAGITARYQPKESARLKSLIEQGRHAQAEKEAKDFFRKRAEPFIKHTSQKGLQLQLADTVHHRGEGGLRRVLQRATGSNIKSHSALIAKLDKDPKALAKFNKARIDYELQEVDRGQKSRQKFRKGLLNRFRQAHQAALNANA